MPKRKKLRTAEEDRAAFIAAAKELGCNESDSGFLDTVERLAATPPISGEKVKSSRQAKKPPKA